MSKKREKKFAEISFGDAKFKIELHDSWLKRLLSGWLKRTIMRNHYGNMDTMIFRYCFVYNQPLLKWRSRLDFIGRACFDKGLINLLEAYEWAEGHPLQGIQITKLPGLTFPTEFPSR